MSPTITVLMDRPPEQAYHGATVAALEHAAAALDRAVDVRVVTTDAIGTLGDGVVIGPGSPYREPMAVESVIRQARERGLPLVGT